MVMWRGPTFSAYYAQIGRIVRQNLDQVNPQHLLELDFDEYLDHLVAEAKWEPLEWHEADKSVEPFSAKVERHDTFMEQTYVVDEQRLRIRIPLSPHPQRADYFKFGPSTLRLTSEPKWKFEDDVLIVEVEASEQAVEGALDDVRFWLGGRNRNIEEGNANLPAVIRATWEAKRRQLEEQQGQTQSVLRKLNIPLHQAPNAKVKPVEIKPRRVRTAIDKPKARRAKEEPALDHDDVMGLVDFIDGYVREFEVNPKTYSGFHEEGLRDLLANMMNANYKGSTTAETFSKLGKTDISMRVYSGRVLICECKFWSGAKAYGEALEQLFGYLTWRQNYGVLINFCKLKDMSRALAEAKRAASEHPTFTEGTLHDQSESRFTSRHIHPQDANKSVEVHHLFVDLSVPKPPD